MISVTEAAVERRTRERNRVDRRQEARARGDVFHLRFAAGLEPSALELEDLDTARFVARFQAGERDVFGEIYMRYFDRVYSYLRVALGDPDGAEDAVQLVFARALAALPRYEWQGRPFRAWLFTIVRNCTFDELRRRSQVSSIVCATEDALSVDPRSGNQDSDGLGWISDAMLWSLVERLPIAQRQVLVLRFLLDLSAQQIAPILDRTPEDVRALQSRALRFLRERLVPLARAGVDSALRRAA